MDGNGNGNGHGRAPALERSIREPARAPVPGGELTQLPGESERELGARADAVRASARGRECVPAESHIVRFRKCFEAAA